jgi:uncharacterized protein YjiS (DUF1127 family)
MSQATTRAWIEEAEARQSARGLVWTALWHAALRSLAIVAARHRERRRVSRGIAELSSLSDRMLSDIGVTRAEIPRVARYGHPERNNRD